MALFPRIASLLRNLSRKDKVERELSEEVSSYVELLTRAKMKDGLSEKDARRAALVELGGAEQVKEQVREVRMGYFIETRWQDLRFAIRTLR
ncbi:MAG: permease prefix domain 1-containing protein [Chthoniobacterales bacterium]